MNNMRTRCGNSSHRASGSQVGSVVPVAILYGGNKNGARLKDTEHACRAGLPHSRNLLLPDSMQ
ncbi:hypothetical protein COMA2_50003 [Candidatus Nitrospira nitrificans]|uniref:Uncharacterized protein n=1 Tax=Candidatus Nitrospira nitrificans TaxID=1742973 RepID=A0A0S4LLX6_9BACT|nr:hypothetical protein COMA2_50003 [Candidatus Nitrospira nitrificans]